MYLRLGLASLIWSCFLAVTSSAPTSAADMSMDNVMEYLNKYEYTGPNSKDPKMKDMMETNMTMAVQSGLMMFQEIHARWGLSMTGEADDATKELMMKPRCGRADIEGMGDMMKRRKKRYLLQGGTWANTDLTYRVTDYPADGDMTQAEVDSEIALAFQVWEKVSSLRFYKLTDINQNPDIYIKFVVSYSDHGDGYPFDGESGTLAHAFYPQGGDIGGDAHFDEAEKWTLNTDAGINLFLVAAHEFGHSLGLGHSGDPDALMAPFYAGYTPSDEFELSADDVAGIREKYPPTATANPLPTIKPPKPQPTIKAPPPPTEMPDVMMDVCKEGVFDTITSLLIGGNHQTVAFRGEHYFKIEDTGGILPGYPKLIKDTWPELPTDLDAAVFLEAQYDTEWVFNKADQEWVLTEIETKPANTLFFKGDQFWMMQEERIKPDYPKSMQNELGFPTDVDAVFQWNRNGDVYIFKGQYYYKYTDGEGVRDGYPKHISAWGSLPEKLDAAFQYRAGNKTSVFFSGNQYYMYNDTSFQIHDGFPTETEPFWLQCDRYSSATIHSASYIAILLAVFVHITGWCNII